MLRTAALLLLVSSFVAPVTARPLVEIEVIDRDSGHWLQQIHHRGQHWIAGTPGHRYSVRLTNTSGERVLVVLSVDGINAITGDTASPAQSGYVLAPWQSSEIAGWRKSYEDVAQFVFTRLPDSYAARTGRPDNVGVIGIAVFQEARSAPIPHADSLARSPPPPAAMDEHSRARPAATAKLQRQEAAAPARQSDAGEQAAQRLGTGHGAREWSSATRTGFVRATARPTQLTQLRYDAHATLVARGIAPREFRPVGPQAFPVRFVADPPPR